MKRSLMWFRNDLRLADNPALIAASGAREALVCLYIVEPRWFVADNWHSRRIGDHQWRFLQQSLQDLDQRLGELGQQLLIRIGDPLTIIPQLMRNHWLNDLYCSAPFGEEERRQYLTLQQQLGEQRCHAIEGSTLFRLEQLPLPLSQLPASFSKFRKQMAAIAPAKPLPAPRLLPASLQLQSEFLPPLATLPQALFCGGESAGLQHAEHYFDSAAPQTYKQTRNALDDWCSSTKFSPWLAHGCLSPRQLWQAISTHEAQQSRNDSTDWIRVELLWREYFQWLALSAQSRLFAFTGTQGIRRPTSFYPERFAKWCQGATPYPIINAAINQLNATGYTSNRARQLLASCFVHELALDWRYGAAYFQQQLIDHDVGCNWGNWQYLAGVGQDPRGWRQFDLAKQTEIYDPDGEFIAKWGGDRHPAPLDSLDHSDWPVTARAEP
ncbi:DASH family cryptochrome [Ferrimonas senticii]|uniref:DASH family cryptochrome n=1 Tax=Ferrimonas senticii TaxID=394566 RepID=UPI00040059C1|nr:DASH family cryptochrome [Ferrimonas senticii]